MILPLVLIVAMSWIVFWISPEMAATQISVSVTSMLTLIAYRFMVDALVPRVSYLTRLDLFILGATLLVFFTLIQAVGATKLAKEGRLPLAEMIDRRCRIIVPVVFVGWFFWSLVL
jgi:cadmium resistance protein CadD (predicted permease)